MYHKQDCVATRRGGEASAMELLWRFVITHPQAVVSGNRKLFNVSEKIFIDSNFLLHPSWLLKYPY